MKISKGNVKNINRKILAGTIAFTFFATKTIGYKAVKEIKYSSTKLGYVQSENFVEDYAMLPEKNELIFNNYVSEFNAKDNYRKIKGVRLHAKKRMYR